MNWTGRENFPRAVENVLLPENSVIHSRYVIQKAEFVSGIELAYLVYDTASQRDVYLYELLPMRWCMYTETGEWTAYHGNASAEFAAVQTAFLGRMKMLMNVEESALTPVLDAFEERGTVWSVTEVTGSRMLSDAMAQQLFTPKEAVDMLAPILDTLAGLHEEGIFHGAITSNAVRLTEDGAVLGDFGACFGEGMPVLSPENDIADVSRLLYAMITGETGYSKVRGLPPALRAALEDGMAGEIPDVVTFWKRLHGDRPAKRKQSAAVGSSRLSRFLNPWTAAIFCVLCAAIPFGIFLAGNRNHILDPVAYAPAEGEIRVPELLELTGEEAVIQAEEMGLYVVIDGHEPNPTVPAGSVILQQPDAGAVLYAEDVIHLTLSSGWISYVPDVRNCMLEDAVQILEDLGFIVEYTETESENDVPGSVVSQDVSPNERLERGSVIHLTVSLGRGDVDKNKLELVGNYVGKQFEDAKKTLSALHLYAFQAKTIYSSTIPAGVIVAQQVPEGKKVAQGTVINMVVSLGEEMTRVPDVGMMNAASARSQLESAGLKAVMCYVSDSSHGMDYVLSQNVAAGEMVPKGSEIWLTVSIGRGSYVESTGGWSGNPLPTAEASEVQETTEETVPEPETYIPEETQQQYEEEPTDPVEPETEYYEEETKAPVDEEPPEEYVE